MSHHSSFSSSHQVEMFDDDEEGLQDITQNLSSTFRENVILMYDYEDVNQRTIQQRRDVGDDDDDEVDEQQPEIEEEAYSGDEASNYSHGLQLRSRSRRSSDDISSSSRGAHGDGRHGGAAALTTSSTRKYTSISKAAFHIFKGNVGVGVFLLPMVFNDCGYLLSPVLGILVGLMVIDATLMLLRVKTMINRSHVSSYPDLCEFVFGKKARHVVNGCLVLVQFGFCLMYMQTAAGIFSEMLPFNGSYTMFVAMEALMLLPLTLLSSNLSLLAIASMIATFLVFFAVFSTFMTLFGTLSAHGPAPSVTAAGHFPKWSLFFASQLSVLEGVGVVLPVENSIKPQNRKHFRKMLRNTLTCIIGLYSIYGLVGYLAYGRKLTQSTVSVLPQSLFAVCIRLALAMNLLLSFPLQFTPAIQICDRALKIEPGRLLQSKRALGLRAGIVVVISLLAAAVGPEALELVLALIGATAATFIAVMLPAALQLQVPVAIINYEAKLKTAAAATMTDGDDNINKKNKKNTKGAADNDLRDSRSRADYEDDEDDEAMQAAHHHSSKSLSLSDGLEASNSSIATTVTTASSGGGELLPPSRPMPPLEWGAGKLWSQRRAEWLNWFRWYMGHEPNRLANHGPVLVAPCGGGQDDGDLFLIKYDDGVAPCGGGSRNRSVVGTMRAVDDASGGGNSPIDTQQTNDKKKKKQKKTDRGFGSKKDDDNSEVDKVVMVEEDEKREDSPARIGDEKNENSATTGAGGGDKKRKKKNTSSAPTSPTTAADAPLPLHESAVAFGVGKQRGERVSPKKAAKEKEKESEEETEESSSVSSPPSSRQQRMMMLSKHPPFAKHKLRCLVYLIFGLYILIVATTTCVLDAIVFFSQVPAGNHQPSAVNLTVPDSNSTL